MYSTKQEINEIYKVHIHNVIKTVHRLKHSKCDREEGLNSDHIINRPHLLTIFLIVCWYMALPLTVCWQVPWCQSLKVTDLY